MLSSSVMRLCPFPARQNSESELKRSPLTVSRTTSSYGALSPGDSLTAGAGSTAEATTGGVTAVVPSEVNSVACLFAPWAVAVSGAEAGAGAAFARRCTSASSFSFAVRATRAAWYWASRRSSLSACAAQVLDSVSTLACRPTAATRGTVGAIGRQLRLLMNPRARFLCAVSDRIERACNTDPWSLAAIWPNASCTVSSNRSMAASSGANVRDSSRSMRNSEAISEQAATASCTRAGLALAAATRLCTKGAARRCRAKRALATSLGLVLARAIASSYAWATSRSPLTRSLAAPLVRRRALATG
mmetsp:Transcript_4843/g.15339  ORF Transcript_4843/g.15339 Transcript_4843/m.15339 type:complete len:303 (+) Transcript_4843:509-1417(+)